MRFAIKFVALIPFVLAAQAGTFTMASGISPGQSNNARGAGTPNVVLTSKDPKWGSPIAGSQWVSFANTIIPDTAAPGDYPLPPTGPLGAGPYQVPNNSIYTFAQIFLIQSTVTSGSLTVMADDSTSVILNGVVLFDEATTLPGNTYSACSDLPIGCTSQTAKTFTVDFTGAMQNGYNTLYFAVAQRKRFSYGLDYFATVTTTAGPGVFEGPTDAPEPSSLVLAGIGVVGLIFYRRHKTR